jgi:hypothetical protein
MCLSGCCICFIHILQVFYLDVTYVLQWFSSVSYVFLSISDIRCKGYIWMFSSPSVASPWCLFFAFCCLASFSNDSGDNGGAHWGRAAWTRAHALPFYFCGNLLLRGAGSASVPSVFLCTRDAEMGLSCWWAVTAAHGSVGWAMSEHVADTGCPGASASFTTSATLNPTKINLSWFYIFMI